MGGFKTIIFVILMPCFLTLKAQNYDQDIHLILQTNTNPVTPSTRPHFVWLNDHKVWKYNPFNLLFGSLLYVYQGVISKQVSSGCPYEINCSNFGKLSIKQFGLVKGLALTADRLTRCSKLAAVDLHPLSINKENRIVDNPVDYKVR